MSLSTLRKKEIILKFGTIKNSGTIEIQVAILSYRINILQKHFLKNRKDHGSRRGLLYMVSQRRKLLDYLKKNCFSRYNILIEKLSLRH